MRVSGRAMLLALALLGVIGGVGALACAGGEEGPTWAIVTADYTSVGDSAVLSPGNDTRVNLLLLLADRAPAGGLRAPDPNKPNANFEWDVLAAQTGPASPQGRDQTDSGGWVAPSRCNSNAAGATAFIAAVNANGRLSPSERQELIAARQALKPSSESGPEHDYRWECVTPNVALPHPQAAAAVDFATYLAGAQHFYLGDFPGASADFGRLSQTADPWLRESALYMVARTKLNAAQQYDEFGDMVEPEKRDLAAIAAAGTAFRSYLAAYPDGRYAMSARGLLRRVAWLAGDGTALANAYVQLLNSPAARDLGSATELTNEIDLKLLADVNSRTVSGPILLAVADLMRMRKVNSEYQCTGRMSWCFKPITKAEIEAQRGQFGNEAELYDFVRASEAFFVRHQPREVLQILPDASHQARFSYLQFGRQMLRGFALEAVGDRNARGFLADLFGGATQPFQRDALELQLAIHDERSGNLPFVFARDSKVRSPYIRGILLDRIAGPDLLRQQAHATAGRERNAALYILLAKELNHGLYSNFLADVALVPRTAPSDGYYMSASEYGFDGGLDQAPAVPLGKFILAQGSGQFDCARLIETVSTLVRSAANNRARLCLAEFMRLKNDWDTLEQPLEGGGLASTNSLFAGPTFQRFEVYKSVISDNAATPDEKAFALYRAIRCYAPSGYNDCGGTEVGKAQRREWFFRLKKDYPQSRWAKSLKYYW